VTGIKKMPKT